MKTTSAVTMKPHRMKVVKNTRTKTIKKKNKKTSKAKGKLIHAGIFKGLRSKPKGADFERVYWKEFLQEIKKECVETVMAVGSKQILILVKDGAGLVAKLFWLNEKSDLIEWKKYCPLFMNEELLNNVDEVAETAQQFFNDHARKVLMVSVGEFGSFSHATMVTKLLPILLFA